MDTPDNISHSTILKRYTIIRASIRSANSYDKDANCHFKLFLGNYSAYEDKNTNPTVLTAGQWKTIDYTPLATERNSLSKEMRLGLMAANADYYLDDICFLCSTRAFELEAEAKRIAHEDSIYQAQEAEFAEWGYTFEDQIDQIVAYDFKGEFIRVMEIIEIIFKALDFDNFEAQISLRDPNDHEKYVGSDEVWEKAERAIVEACQEKGLKATVEYGEAAFYGPKLDFMVKDALGRRWQLGTIQVDYNLPQRFELEYIASDNQKERPVMIHRAPFGSMERFVAVLIEHTAGKFPLWLTPDQVAILPISEKANDYAYKVQKELEDRYEIRGFVDDRNEKIGRKIRDNEVKHIPYMLVVGEKEAENGEVNVRKQGAENLGNMKIDDFGKKIADEVNSMINKW